VGRKNLKEKSLSGAEGVNHRKRGLLGNKIRKFLKLGALNVEGNNRAVEREGEEQTWFRANHEKGPC